MATVKNFKIRITLRLFSAFI